MTTTTSQRLALDFDGLSGDQLNALHTQLHAELDRRRIEREAAEAAAKSRRRREYWTRRRAGCSGASSAGWPSNFRVRLLTNQVGTPALTFLRE